MSDTASPLTEDAFLGGRLRLSQPRRGHRAGHDAVLLAAATPARSGERVVDLGAGIGAAGLAVAVRVENVELVLVERDAELARIAQANITANRASGRAVALDVMASAAAFAEAGLLPDSVDRVLMNPPFNDPARHRASPDPARRSAHEEGDAGLAGWLRAARRILKPGATATLIWRADGIAAVLDAFATGFGGVTILPIHPRPSAPAIRILVRGTKGSAAPVALLPGIVLNDASGVAPPEITEVLDGRAVLPLATP